MHNEESNRIALSIVHNVEPYYFELLVTTPRQMELGVFLQASIDSTRCIENSLHILVTFLVFLDGSTSRPGRLKDPSAVQAECTPMICG